MLTKVKQLFCIHKYEHVANLYGIFIILNDWKRSEWECTKCGKLKFKDKYYYEEEK